MCQGYADLKQDFPGLVYCSITGWGQTGPYSARPGYDALVQAWAIGVSFASNGLPRLWGAS